MSSTTLTRPDHLAAAPSALRRTAVGATAFLACALPTVWALGSASELAGGSETEHRFHQLTGQGLLLCALWLAGLLPLVRAGWRGERASTAAALHALAVAVTALVAGAAAPEGGGLAVGAVVAVTSGLLVLASPLRPALRVSLAVDPLRAPVALLTAALLTAFAVGQLDRQGSASDEHASLAHYFDMGWLALLLAVLGLLDALLPAARRLGLWAAAGTLVIGLGRLGFTDDGRTWSVGAVVLGLSGLAAVALPARKA